MTARSPSPRVDVAITGLGVVSAAGIDTAATWTRILADRPTARVCPALHGLPADLACQIEDLDAAARLGANFTRRTDRAPAPARLAGFGASADAYHFTAPHPDGRGLEQAVTRALRRADADLRDVDHVNAHATSAPKGDLAEAALIERLFGDRVCVTAPKGVVGHTLGAAGAIEAALTVLSIVEQSVPPTANFEPDEGIHLDLVTGEARAQPIAPALSNSSGFGGRNAVLAFTPA